MWPLGTQVDLENLIPNAFARTDEIHLESRGGSDLPQEDMALEEDMDNFEELMPEFLQPVYDGC